jgi:glycosyltransferase involved in cell wall biosynthesis
MTSITIVTASYNAAATIEHCLQCVAAQSFPAEHIVIDGASKDGTVQIVKSKFPKVRLVSEPDQGIYDAMNKGIELARGDIVGLLNADDFYINDRVLELVVRTFEEKRVDSVFADLVIVKPDNLHKVVRYYRGDGIHPGLMAFGMMPPHPTFFVRKEMYTMFGRFKVNYQIAADFELLLRFLVKHKISYAYLPEIIVKMRSGGVSTRGLKSTWILNKEIMRACKENGVSTNYLKIYSKYLTKWFQLAHKPSGF